MRDAISKLGVLTKGGPYYGPKGGKYADPQHKISWGEDRPTRRVPAPDAQERPTKLAPPMPGKPKGKAKLTEQAVKVKTHAMIMWTDLSEAQKLTAVDFDFAKKLVQKVKGFNMPPGVTQEDLALEIQNTARLNQKNVQKKYSRPGMKAVKSMDAIDSLGALSKASFGGGWSAIPKGKHNGQRRRKGSGYEYRYPDGKGGWKSSPGGASKPKSKKYKGDFGIDGLHKDRGDFVSNLEALNALLEDGSRKKGFERATVKGLAGTISGLSAAISNKLNNKIEQLIDDDSLEARQTVRLAQRMRDQFRESASNAVDRAISGTEGKTSKPPGRESTKLKATERLGLEAQAWALSAPGTRSDFNNIRKLRLKDPETGLDTYTSIERLSDEQLQAVVNKRSRGTKKVADDKIKQRSEGEKNGKNDPIEYDIANHIMESDPTATMNNLLRLTRMTGDPVDREVALAIYNEYRTQARKGSSEFKKFHEKTQGWGAMALEAIAEKHGARNETPPARKLAAALSATYTGDAKYTKEREAVLDALESFTPELLRDKIASEKATLTDLERKISSGSNYLRQAALRQSHIVEMLEQGLGMKGAGNLSNVRTMSVGDVRTAKGRIANRSGDSIGAKGLFVGTKVKWKGEEWLVLDGQADATHGAMPILVSPDYKRISEPVNPMRVELSTSEKGFRKRKAADVKKKSKEAATERARAKRTKAELATKRTTEKKQKATGGLGGADPLEAWRKKKAALDAKKSGDAIDDVEMLVKAAGWGAIPGGRKGGQRQPDGKGGFRYRYPDGQGGWKSSPTKDRMKRGKITIAVAEKAWTPVTNALSDAGYENVSYKTGHRGAASIEAYNPNTEKWSSATVTPVEGGFEIAVDMGSGRRLATTKTRGAAMTMAAHAFDTEKLAKKSGDAIDGLELLVKGGDGWAAAPGSKKGAQRKKSGKGYKYRYPDGKGGWTSKKATSKKASSKIGQATERQKEVFRQMQASASPLSNEDIEKLIRKRPKVWTPFRGLGMTTAERQRRDTMRNGSASERREARHAELTDRLMKEGSSYELRGSDNEARGEYKMAAYHYRAASNRYDDASNYAKTENREGLGEVSADLMRRSKEMDAREVSGPIREKSGAEQKAKQQATSRGGGQRDQAFQEMQSSGNPLTNADIEKLIEKNPVYVQFRGRGVDAKKSGDAISDLDVLMKGAGWSAIPKGGKGGQRQPDGKGGFNYRYPTGNGGWTTKAATSLKRKKVKAKVSSGLTVTGPRGHRLKVTIEKMVGGKFMATIHGTDGSTMTGASGLTPMGAAANTQKLIDQTESTMTGKYVGARLEDGMYGMKSKKKKGDVVQQLIAKMKRAGVPTDVVQQLIGKMKGDVTQRLLGKCATKSYFEPSLKKGMYGFEDGPNSANALPDNLLPQYLAAFVEEAYEHEKRECEHRKNEPPGHDEKIEFYAMRIMNELVMCMRKNKDLTRAAKGVTADGIANILRNSGLIQPDVSGYSNPEGNGYEAMAYSGSKHWADLSKGPVKREAEVVPSPQAAVADDTLDPMQELQKAQQRAHNTVWRVPEASYATKGDGGCPIHGYRDLTKMMNLQHIYGKCTCS